MDVGLTRLFHCRNMHEVVFFNPILSRAPKQYLEIKGQSTGVFVIKHHYILFCINRQFKIH